MSDLKTYHDEVKERGNELERTINEVIKKFQDETHFVVWEVDLDHIYGDFEIVGTVASVTIGLGP